MGMSKMVRLPSPAMCVALVALVFSLGGIGYSATGGNFLIGRTNVAATPTFLAANLNGRTLQLSNTTNGADATPLSIVSHPARPPMIVDSSVKVANLNADKLDGIDSAQFTQRMVIPFNLSASAVSLPIPLPANLPVYLLGSTSTGNF